MNKISAPRVVIIGGAMIGSSIAWWLSRHTDAANVTVIEMDPCYEWASTSHTNSCIRQQFGSEINIRLSQFTAEFIARIRDWMGAEAPEITLDPFGYMYLSASERMSAALRDAHELQTRCGAHTRLLAPDEIARMYPFYQLDDIQLGSHNQVSEGYFDGGTLFDCFRNGARKAGVTYQRDRAIGLAHKNGRITAVRLASGAELAADVVVNAAGPRAADLLRLVDLDLPVEPRKRFTFVFDAAEPLDRPLPLTIDPSGVHVRSDGRYYMAGCAPDDDHAVAPDDFDMDHTIWQEKVWPAIATRIPAFERIKLVREWVGHYAYNTLDQNAILGPHPDMPNLVLANGFSGHGLQQAPGIGRGIAEWILTESWGPLDLSPLSMRRIRSNTPLIERNVI